MAITCFDGEYAFLSNFYLAPVEFEGLMYTNSEAAFQSAKTMNIEDRKRFCNLNPGTAKRAGRHLSLRSDWERSKDLIMEIIVKDKFIRNKDLQKLLLMTHNEELIEGNHWKDYYWGVCNGKGKNTLGKILIKVRSELRDWELINTI